MQSQEQLIETIFHLGEVAKFAVRSDLTETKKVCAIVDLVSLAQFAVDGEARVTDRLPDVKRVLKRAEADDQFFHARFVAPVKELRKAHNRALRAE